MSHRPGDGCITRREFLGDALLAGTAVLVGCGGPDPAPEQRVSRTRKVWALADPHVGLGPQWNDGREGGDWLAVSIEDVRQNVRDVDYVLALGDVTHNAGREDELVRYVALRERSDCRDWFELAGNHDYGAIPTGRWRRLVKRPVRYVLVDGTAAWFFVSAEQGRSDGKVSTQTARWLTRSVRAHQDQRNIIVCTHQAVHGTVAGAQDSGAILNPRGAVRKILRDVRVDLWLCGHIHAGRRHAGYVARRGHTTFINVASAGRAYSTHACNGYVLEMTEGTRTLRARCRDHEAHQDLADQSVDVPFPHAWRFFDRPKMLAPRMPAQAAAV